MQWPLDELRVNHALLRVHLVVFLWWLVVLLWCVVVLRFRDDCCVSNSCTLPLPLGGILQRCSLFWLVCGVDVSVKYSLQMGCVQNIENKWVSFCF
jgi:hypothetical protein